MPTLFAVIVGAELVVLILAFAPLTREGASASAFGAASLFAQWSALTSVVLLCKLRNALSRMSPMPGALLAWFVPVAVTALGAWMLYEIDQGLHLLGARIADPKGFVIRCAALAGLIGAVALRYAWVQEQWRQRLSAQGKAESEALQARIRPHFLFNSMNTIASLVRSNPPKAERAVEDLSDLFRAALGAGEGDSTLAEEVELAERFLAIETLRLGDRLRVRWERAEPLPWTLKLPRLVLQPLVENAVIHGIAQLAEGGEIAIDLRVQDKQLRVTVGNPCLAGTDASAGNGHAQQNVLHRLRYRFGKAAGMATRHDAGYYACELTLPIS